MSEYITKQQAAVLAFIKAFIASNGYPPTRTEMRDHFKWSSANAAQDHLLALARNGWIELIPKISRGIRLT